MTDTIDSSGTSATPDVPGLAGSSDSAGLAGVVLITGTNTGIGLETALACAAAGWRTVATVRSPDRAAHLLERAGDLGVEIDVRSLEVTSAPSIATLMDEVLADYSRLDALVNNAGAAHVGTIELDDLAEVRRCLEVNFFSVVALTKAALPHLRASRGRVVTISSVGGIVGQPFNEAYCAAKFAVEGFMESLAAVAATVGVDVCIVEPGAVASSFVQNAGLDPAAMLAAAGPYAPALDAYLRRTSAQFGSAAQSPAEVAAVVLTVLTADQPPTRVQTSSGAKAFAGVKLADLDGSAVQGMVGSWLR